MRATARRAVALPHAERPRATRRSRRRWRAASERGGGPARAARRVLDLGAGTGSSFMAPRAPPRDRGRAQRAMVGRRARRARRTASRAADDAPTTTTRPRARSRSSTPRRAARRRRRAGGDAVAGAEAGPIRRGCARAPTSSSPSSSTRGCSASASARRPRRGCAPARARRRGRAARRARDVRARRRPRCAAAARCCAARAAAVERVDARAVARWAAIDERYTCGAPRSRTIGSPRRRPRSTSFSRRRRPARGGVALDAVADGVADAVAVRAAPRGHAVSARRPRRLRLGAGAVLDAARARAARRPGGAAPALRATWRRRAAVRAEGGSPPTTTTRPTTSATTTTSPTRPNAAAGEGDFEQINDGATATRRRAIDGDRRARASRRSACST